MNIYINKKISLNKYFIIGSLLFIALFKAYFIPEVFRQIIKIGILGGVFLFTCAHLPKKNLINFSLLYSILTLFSSLLSYFHGDYLFSSLLDSLLYSFSFYVLYTSCKLSYLKKQSINLIKGMYFTNLIFCFLTICSFLLVGVENNSNNAAYFFGNKFTSSYLFILLIALYGVVHDMDRKINIIKMTILFIISILFTLALDCATGTVVLSILFLLYLFPTRIIKVLTNKNIVVVLIIFTGLIVFWMNSFLNNEYINNLVFDYFDRSYTVYGRLEIYDKYLKDIIMNRFWFGYGYNSSIMYKTTGMYSNAQNGIFDIFLSFGFVGTLTLLATVYYCFKNKKNNKNVFYLSFVVYGMIIASIFEVTINWFFLLGICLIRWSDDIDSTKYKIE